MAVRVAFFCRPDFVYREAVSTSRLGSAADSLYAAEFRPGSFLFRDSVAIVSAFRTSFLVLRSTNLCQHDVKVFVSELD